MGLGAVEKRVFGFCWVAVPTDGVWVLSDGAGIQDRRNKIHMYFIRVVLRDSRTAVRRATSQPHWEQIANWAADVWKGRETLSETGGRLPSLWDSLDETNLYSRRSIVLVTDCLHAVPEGHAATFHRTCVIMDAVHGYQFITHQRSVCSSLYSRPEGGWHMTKSLLCCVFDFNARQIQGRAVTSTRHGLLNSRRQLDYCNHVLLLIIQSSLWEWHVLVEVMGHTFDTNLGLICNNII